MNWIVIGEILYGIILLLVCLRIIYDTKNTSKSLAYLILSIFLPVFGMIIYFLFGINYRVRKIYKKKLSTDQVFAQQIRKDVFNYSKEIKKQSDKGVGEHRELALMLVNESQSPLTVGNKVKLLVNGERKFEDVLEALQSAKDHIHMEYYIYEDDEIGKEIEQILISKAREGVTVRFIYDDFGSRSLRKRMTRSLKEAGVQVFPFYRIIFLILANRINYRNHRKIIIVDGQTAFVGGINVSDRYINKPNGKNKLFWRDTHLRIDGMGVQYLQFLFLADWNFCADDTLGVTPAFFPPLKAFKNQGDKIVQIAASGPDSDAPTILYALLQAIYLAKEEILISTPYFIPGDSLLDALMVSALGGVKVKLLVPHASDSKVVDLASRSYYDDLLKAGAEIYLYRKGFMHAKTMVTDRKIAIVGSANMDYRSFDLNFEVNAIVYDREIAIELADVFNVDLKDAEQINPDEWFKRPLLKQLMEKTTRLVSPLL